MRECVVYDVMCGVCLRVSMRGMPPQPHPPSRRVAWLRPLPAPQSPDCVRGRVHRHAALRVRRAQLKAAAFPAQHIRSALSQGVAVGSAHRRLWRIPAGRRVRMRRGLPSPGSVGIPPVAGSAASRLPPSAFSRRHRLRLVPPPLQPAPLFHGTKRKMCNIEESGICA